MSSVLRGSVTRIADLPPWPFPFQPLDRAEWASGDYVVAEVLARSLPTEGGCFGAVTSRSRFAKPMLPLEYRGHVVHEGSKLKMSDFVPEPPDRDFDIPVVLVAGTSMSAGKTHSGRVAVRELKRLGHTVVAAKLTLEPYNGGTLVDMLGDQVAFTLMAASDPYAVVGIRTAWGKDFDLVVGPTTNTKAGVALVHELAGLAGLDLLDVGTHGSLRRRLEAAVGSRG